MSKVSQNVVRPLPFTLKSGLAPLLTYFIHGSCLKCAAGSPLNPTHDRQLRFTASLCKNSISSLQGKQTVQMPVFGLLISGLY